MHYKFGMCIECVREETTRISGRNNTPPVPSVRALLIGLITNSNTRARTRAHARTPLEGAPPTHHLRQNRPNPTPLFRQSVNETQGTLCFFCFLDCNLRQPLFRQRAGDQEYGMRFSHALFTCVFVCSFHAADAAASTATVLRVGGPRLARGQAPQRTRTRMRPGVGLVHLTASVSRSFFTRHRTIAS